MSRDRLDALTGLVTDHGGAVVLAALLLTVGMLVGIANAEMGGGEGMGGAVDTTVDEKTEYVRAQYGTGGDGGDTAQFPVYVREEDGNVLDRETLLATLRFQRSVAEDPAVADARTGDEVRSVAWLVGGRAAGGPDATLDERIAAIEATDEEAVATLVRETIGETPGTSVLLPDSYEPGTATAESTQVVFAFEADEDGRPPAAAQRALFDAAEEREDAEFFTLGDAATERQTATAMENTMTLVLPAVLGLILLGAAAAYRDPVDVVVGVVGVLVSVVWMFGILGWLGVDVGPAVVIGPVLIAGISIDYGFHVFTRYREERGPDEGIRAPMRRSLRSVGTAFALVTLTASIGFLSNLVNGVGTLRSLGIAITLGVVSAFLAFVTLVPALKIVVDGALERVGIERRPRPLGDGAVVGTLLSSTVTLARRAAPVVIAAGLLVAGGGALAWTALDEEPMGGPSGDVAEWKGDLPGPVGWEENEVVERRAYVSDQFRAAGSDEGDRVGILIEGAVTEDGALSAIEAGIDEGVDRGAFAESRIDTVRSPVTVIRAVTAEDEAFAETVRAADTDGDGVPDTNLEAVYDHLFEVAPERAAAVIERTDGEYRSLRVIGPPGAAGSLGVDGDRATALFAVGDAVEERGDDLTATVVSDATREGAAIRAITDGIVEVTLVALAAVALALIVLYRHLHGSATLGAVTAAPIAIVLGFVLGGMYLLAVPLTFLTALLVSLVIGVGVDYTIHVSDRFVDELDGADPVEALETAVTGTGGALLGSMLTSVAAFAGMLLHPNPAFGNFATLVVLAMVGAFLTSVVVLPSLLYTWARYSRDERAAGTAEPAAAVSD